MKHIHITLVEDNRTEAARVTNELAGAGMTGVRQVALVRDALELMEREPADILLLDIDAADFDGMTTLRMLGKKAEETAVILLCGAENSAQIDTLCGVAQDFLLKEDISAQVLVHVIRFAMKRQALTVQLRRKAEEVELLKESMEGVMQQSMGAVLVIDGQKRIIYANGAAADLFGRLPEELRGTKFAYGVAAGQTLDTEVETAGGTARSVEMRGVEMLWERRPATLITLRDNTDERAADTVYIDALTGVNNKAYFDEQARYLDCPQNLPLCVIVGDVNNLQLVNDSLGYKAGDEMLKMVADCFRSACRRESVVIRYGGDEFLLIQSRCNETDAKGIMDRIRKGCKESSLEGFPVSLALGSAVKYSGDTLSIADLLTIADEHMFAKKYTVDSPSKYGAALSTLEKSLYAKDYTTAMHTSRVRDLCVSFGQYLQMEPSVIDELIILSALHDIGKIALPSSVLCKPGPLAEDEWETIKTHPVIGAKIAKITHGMDVVARNILSHHERWDGTGYPNGQKGEEIPLSARVLSIVDSFDVMTHERPYKRAISQKEALEEIERCAGTQFDPQLAQAFVAFIRGRKAPDQQENPSFA